MKNTKSMDFIKEIFSQIANEKLHDLKKEITASNSRIDQLETKLGIAYDELARNKEEFNRIESFIQ